MPSSSSSVSTIIMALFQTPREVLDAWSGGVNSGAMDEVLALYHEEALLLPTFSNRRLYTPAKIRDYFTKLFERGKVQVNLHEKTVVAQTLKDSICAMSGIYRWDIDMDGDELSFEARFTFALDLESPAPIMHHHSSQVPRTL